MCTLIWRHQQHEPDTESSQTPTARKADYIVYDAKRVDIGEDGQVVHQLFAKKLSHYPDDDSNELFKIKLILNRQGGVWHVSADYGKSLKGNKKIELWDNVVVRKVSDGTGPDTLLETDKLVYLPDEEIAETQQPVTITQGKSVVKAKGMRAHLVTRKIELLGNVRGHYEETSP